MESLEVSAKTVRGAVDLALERLGVSAGEVEIEIISGGKGGILGIGAEDARVRVTVREKASLPQEDLVSQAAQSLKQLLNLMKISGEVQQQEGATPEEVVLEVWGPSLSSLIGPRGQTLAALQFLVNLIVSRHYKTRTTVSVDVAGYRRRRQQTLKSLALRVAERVKGTGQSITLEPMPTAERRQIHLVLREDPLVVTYSVGEGNGRKVIISPQKR